MSRHDISGWREQFTDTGLNCKEALEFYCAFWVVVLTPLLYEYWRTA
jgi:hypothetical protein